jgi:hypothetical protein
MFNATDIPVNGFIHHVALHDGLMSGALADLASRLVSGAPGYAADKARLSGILGAAPHAAAAAAAPAARGPSRPPRGPTSAPSSRTPSEPRFSRR